MPSLERVFIVLGLAVWFWVCVGIGMLLGEMITSWAC